MKVEIKKDELLEIFLAIFVLSFIFSISNFTLTISSFLKNFLFLTLVIFTKEIIQKIYARTKGYYSRFKIYPISYILSIFVSVIGIKLAAPGYTQLLPYKFSEWKYSRRRYSVEDEGKIILIGLLVFFAFSTILLFTEYKNLKNIISLIIVFNMLPILPFDGTRILKWNFGIWCFLFIFSLILLIL